MKIMNRILISLVMSLLFSNIAVANYYNPVLKVEGNKFYLSLEDVSEQTSVRILDDAGFAWVEEKVTVSGQFKKVFDLEDLPVGSYQLIIKSKLKETIQPIAITDQELLMDENKRAVYYQAKISKKRASVNLTLANPTNSRVQVTVLSPAGRIAYRNEIKDQLDIDESYNLRHLPAGDYTVIIDNSREAFTHTIRLR